MSEDVDVVTDFAGVYLAVVIIITRLLVPVSLRRTRLVLLVERHLRHVQLHTRPIRIQLALLPTNKKSAHTNKTSTYELFGTHIVEYSLRRLAVVSRLHDGQQQFRGVVLQLQHEVHPILAQWINFVEYQRGDDVNSVTFVRGNRILHSEINTTCATFSFFSAHYKSLFVVT